MATPFLGQLMLASFNFAPNGYAQCNGQLLAINQNTALFSLLGTTFGGNGIQNFALPNLQGATPVGVGNGIGYGQVGGEPSHTLSISEVPIHTHQLSAAGGANLTKPAGALIAGGGGAIYTPGSNLTTMNGASLSQIGGGQPHENRQPFLVMNWLIAMVGIFPSRD
ncbi:MAG: tail fiber protein [Terracidiphilus sp.]|jgi:microcystin-dependent protein